ncbi:MAG: LPS export ABC transporter periplasmic protein LptC [Ghiorsea sp.]
MVGKPSLTLTWLKWSCLGLSVASVLLAIFLMMTAKHSLQDLVNVVALQSGASIEKPNITKYDGEDLVWRLQAECAVEEKGYVDLEQPNIDWYTQTREMMFLSAAHGQYHKQDKKMLFKGEVVLLFQGWTLHSESALFDENTSVLDIASSFEMKKDGIAIKGKKMLLSRDNGRVKVMQGVRMMIEQAP